MFPVPIPQLEDLFCCVLLLSHFPDGIAEGGGSPAALQTWYTAPRCFRSNSEIPFPIATLSSQFQIQEQETDVRTESKAKTSQQSQGSRWFLTDHCQLPHLKEAHGLGGAEAQSVPKYPFLLHAVQPMLSKASIPFQLVAKRIKAQSSLLLFSALWQQYAWKQLIWVTSQINRELANNLF